MDYRLRFGWLLLSEPLTYAWKKIPWCHSRSLELAWICRETIKNEEQVKVQETRISWNSGTWRSTPILGKSPASKEGIFSSALHMQSGVQYWNTQVEHLVFSRLDSWKDSDLAECFAEPYPLLIKFLQWQFYWYFILVLTKDLNKM